MPGINIPKMGQIIGIFTVFTSKISTEVKNIFTWINLKIAGPIKDIRGFLNTKMREITVKPSRQEDYKKFGSIWVAKKFLILGGLGLVLGVYALGWIIFPWADGKAWAASMEYGSEKYKNFTGNAIVYDKGRKIYTGEMDSGKFVGIGKQYDENGNLIYEGEFKNSEWDGDGKKYEVNGIMQYSGKFTSNLYEGSGELYNQNGKKVYSGSFSAGQKSGKGTEYYPNTGNQRNVGEYKNGQREGQGTEYEEDGHSLSYTGGFVGDLYEGEGRMFKNGKILYQGKFAAGQYDGEGTLYDIDNGTAIYRGGFVRGKFEGSGTQYDEKTSKLLYKGSFERGKRQGDGAVFDSLGSEVFKGVFIENDINYPSYFSKDYDMISTEMGIPNSKIELADDELAATHLNKNFCILFNKDPEKDGIYNCSKFVLRPKAKFRGLSPKSTLDQINAVMGKEPLSIIDEYTVRSIYDPVFAALSMEPLNKESVVKYRYAFENYSVCFYCDSTAHEILAVIIAAF